LVLAPVLLPATITGFHIVADGLRNRRAMSHAS
jgi:hypothetical protein